MKKTKRKVLTKKEMIQKERARKIVDRTIEIVLMIVIIMLLLYSCDLAKQKGKEKTPNGNVNIIEIKCDEDGQCDVDIDDADKKTDNNAGNKTPNGKAEKKSSKKSDNNSNKPSEDTEEDDGEFHVLDKDVTWSGSSDLKIFANSLYDFEDKIAPECSNTYKFVVKNSTDYNLKYSINFTETNPYNINLKYKLKKNGSYIISDYVSYDQLNISEVLLNSKNSDTYYLDWKWISSENDTQAGEIQANYKLQINVEAESVND